MSPSMSLGSGAPIGCPAHGQVVSSTWAGSQSPVNNLMSEIHPGWSEGVGETRLLGHAGSRPGEPL